MGEMKGGPTCDPKKEITDLSKLIDAKKLIPNASKETKKKAKDAIAKAGEIAGQIGDGFMNNLEDILSKLKKVIASVTEGGAAHAGNKSAHDADKDISDAHVAQDAKAEIKWTAMIHPDVKYTELVPLRDTGYSTYEDYPTSKGWINEEKDYEKRNFTTGEWWNCHHTGYLQKVDGSGNFETKIPGTELYYTFGDRGNVCASNEDNLVMMNKYNHVMEEMTEVVDGNVFNNYNMNVVETILLSQTEAIGVARTVVVGAVDTLKVGLNQNISVGGNINITAGGIITIKGAQIYLN